MIDFQKRYIQFNDLVIDSFEMLDSGSYTVNTKTNAIDYSYRNGAYTAYTSEAQLTESIPLSMSLKLSMKKLSCEQRRFYKDYVMGQLIKVGRLWAIQGDRIVWAWAHLTSYGEDITADETSMTIDVNFLIPQGNWYKADVLKVFLRPYDPCDFLECEDWLNIPECYDTCGALCPNCHTTGTVTCDVCNCRCKVTSRDIPLCGAMEELKNFYKTCSQPYRVIYDCEAGTKLYGEQMLGQKFCKRETCESIISGRVYSDGLQDTEDWTISIVGKFNDPYLTINGNILKIDGEYDGIMTIKDNYEVYFREDKDCCEDYLISADLVNFPDGSTYGMVFKHGYNPFILETNECCKMACIYFKLITTTI